MQLIVIERASQESVFLEPLISKGKFCSNQWVWEFKSFFAGFYSFF